MLRSQSFVYSTTYTLNRYPNPLSTAQNTRSISQPIYLQYDIHAQSNPNPLSIAQHTQSISQSVAYSTRYTLNQNPNPLFIANTLNQDPIPLPTAQHTHSINIPILCLQHDIHVHAQSKSQSFVYNTTRSIKIPISLPTGKHTRSLKILIGLPTAQHAQSRYQSICLQYNTHTHTHTHTQGTTER